MLASFFFPVVRNMDISYPPLTSLIFPNPQSPSSFQYKPQIRSKDHLKFRGGKGDGCSASRCVGGSEREWG